MLVGKEELFAHFDEIGEETVRERLNLGRYGDHRQGYAREWLRLKDQSRSNERERRKTTRQMIVDIAAIVAAVAATIAAIASIVTIIIMLHN